MNEFQNVLKLCYQNVSLVSEEIIAPKIIYQPQQKKKHQDQGNKYGVLLNDLSKAFDCLPHDLIVAKLHAYGFLIESFKLLNSNLTERKQTVKINDQFNSWLDIVAGVPQGSIVGPLLFNMFLCDMFRFCNDIDFASYEDDSTP